MSVENHPPYPADQVTGTGEKGQDHGPVRKAAHISLPWGIMSNWPMWPSGRGDGGESMAHTRPSSIAAFSRISHPCSIPDTKLEHPSAPKTDLPSGSLESTDKKARSIS